MSEDRLDRLVNELAETNARLRELQAWPKHDNGIQGEERREYLFTQSQVEWLRHFIEDRLKIALADATIRIILLVAGAVAVAITLTVIGLKH